MCPQHSMLVNSCKISLQTALGNIVFLASNQLYAHLCAAITFCCSRAGMAMVKQTRVAERRDVSEGAIS